MENIEVKKMRMTRLISCFLIICLALSLCGCKKGTTNDTGTAYTYNPLKGAGNDDDIYYNFYDELNPDTTDSVNNGNTGNSSSQSSDNKSNNTNKLIEANSDAPFVNWENSKLSAPGKAFTLPDIKQGGGASPVVATVSKQVYPGDSITVMGEGFNTRGTKAYYISDNGTKEAEKQTINDTQMEVTINSDEQYGVYGVYLKNSNGTSSVKMVNVPSVWWLEYTDVNAGNEVSIFGENLTHDNNNTTNVYLLDGNNWFKMNVTYADPHKVTVQIPRGLESDKQYSLKLHNGHGGELAWAPVKEKITFKKYLINTRKGNVINVADYGARPDDKTKNSTRAIYAAVQAAEIGDTIYFPAGTYLMKSGITVAKSLKFAGAGADKTKIIMYDKISETPGALFILKAGPIEFSGIGFEDVRKKKFNNYFISYNGDSFLNGNYNLYVHDCSFLQSCPKKTPYTQHCIYSGNATNIWIKNNKFESAGVLFANVAENIIVTNNEICGVSYAVANYHQNQLLIWDTQKLDFSNNKVYGKDLIDDPNGTLEYGDQTVGRTVALQNSNSNIYIGNNNLKRVGLPKDNAGEQFLFEDMICAYDGNLKSASAGTVDLLFDPYSNLTTRTVVMITEGKGVGQYRYVKSYNNKSVTVDKDWDIIPDSTSRVIIFKSFSNVAVYNNSITGFKNHTKEFTMTNGTCLYGNMVNGFFTHNDFRDMSYGMLIVTHYRWGAQDYEGNGNASRTSGLYWIQCDYNKVSDCAIGFSYTVENMFKESNGKGVTYDISKLGSEKPTNLTLGFTFRGNTIQNMSDFESEDRSGFGGIGILVGSMDWRLRTHPQNTCNGGWMQGTLIENNTIKNCANNNVVLCKHQGNTILSENKISGSVKTLWGEDPSRNEPNHTSTAIIYPPVEYKKSGK